MVTKSSAATHLEWSPESRLVRMRFTPQGVLDRNEAGLISRSISEWTSDDQAPYAILVDASGVPGTDAEFRTRMRELFKPQRQRVSIAVVNTNLMLRVTVDMFRVATGVDIKAFADEPTARSWLAERGFTT